MSAQILGKYRWTTSPNVAGHEIEAAQIYGGVFTATLLEKRLHLSGEVHLAAALCKNEIPVLAVWLSRDEER